MGDHASCFTLARLDRCCGDYGVGVYIGGPVYWGPYYGYPYYYPPPYYYYPPAPAEPQVYVERIDPAQQGFWFYCDQDRAYYPYVKECPAGWRRVPAAPPPG